jgi:hypothetical protein
MNPAYRFARGGKVYKELESDEAHQIAGYIRAGVISANDDYWMPGMTDWKKVYTRQWDFPKQPASSSPPKPNPAKPAPTPSTASSAGMKHDSFECMACKQAFAQPAKANSGYSVIGKAAVFFVFGFILLVVSTFIYLGWTLTASFGDSRLHFVMACIVQLILSLAGLGLILMSIFELISAAVTHGIYRSSPLRCPHCSSSTYTRSGLGSQ